MRETNRQLGPCGNHEQAHDEPGSGRRAVRHQLPYLGRDEQSDARYEDHDDYFTERPWQQQDERRHHHEGERSHLEFGVVGVEAENVG